MSGPYKADPKADSKADPEGPSIRLIDLTVDNRELFWNERKLSHPDSDGQRLLNSRRSTSCRAPPFRHRAILPHPPLGLLWQPPTYPPPVSPRSPGSARPPSPSYLSRGVQGVLEAIGDPADVRHHGSIVKVKSTKVRAFTPFGEPSSIGFLTANESHS